jgi:hypothetical protein
MNYWEAWWWTTGRWLRHPVESFSFRRKRRNSPVPGDRVTDCRGLTLRVAAVDEYGDLTLEDGTRVSWMHCCSWPEKP